MPGIAPRRLLQVVRKMKNHHCASKHPWHRDGENLIIQTDQANNCYAESVGCSPYGAQIRLETKHGFTCPRRKLLSIQPWLPLQAHDRLSNP